MALRRALEVYFSVLGQTLQVKGQQRQAQSIAFKNDRYLGIADYTRPSTERRFFLLDLEQGRVEKHYVSHGSGSGSLKAARFSNLFDSHQTSLGIFITGETYYSRAFRGTALKVYGLEATNTNASARLIVAHPASYASPNFIEARRERFAQTQDLKDAPRLGLSRGCFAFDPAVAGSIIERLKNGALIYSYTEGAEKKILESADYQEIQVINPEDEKTNLSPEETLQRELDEPSSSSESKRSGRGS